MSRAWRGDQWQGGCGRRYKRIGEEKKKKKIAQHPSQASVGTTPKKSRDEWREESVVLSPIPLTEGRRFTRWAHPPRRWSADGELKGRKNKDEQLVKRVVSEQGPAC